ncbi:MAG: glycosyltransferase family 1 protein [Deinococcota bacterium]
MTQRLTGVQRYALEMCKALSKLDDVNLRVMHPRVTSGQPLQTPAPGQLEPVGQIGGHAWEQAELGPNMLYQAVKHTPAPLLWSPCNVGPLAVRRQIVTIHDLVSMLHPEWVSRAFHLYYKTLLPLLAKRVQHIVTISQHSRETILETLGVPESKVTVIPNGIGAQFQRVDATAIDSVRERYKLPDSFVLSLGSLEPRKNLMGLINAWLQLPKATRLPLVIAGGLGERGVFGDFNTDVLDKAGVQRLGYVDDADLPALLSAARLFAYPSLEEGFGLPPLEALACGTQVVTSNTSAMAENCQGEAILVDPTDKTSIAEGIETALAGDEPLDARLERAERIRTRFNWQTGAEALIDVVKACL